MNAAAITELGKRFNLQPDSVYIESSDIVTDLMYGNKFFLLSRIKMAFGKAVHATSWRLPNGK